MIFMTEKSKKAFQITALFRVLLYIMIASQVMYEPYADSIAEWLEVIFYSFIFEFLLLVSPPFIEQFFKTKKSYKEELLQVRAEIDEEIREYT